MNNDTITSLMTDTKTFQQKVIDAGIRGKLTKQLPEDGNAEDLYQQIQEEKAKLVKEGKIKKSKPLPKIKPEEIPFEIPKNWKWVRLGEIGSWSAGATPSRSNPDYYNGDIPWVKTGELNDDYIDQSDEYISEFALKECSVRLNPVGSVLIAMYGATIGKTGILNIEATTNQACCACIPYLIDNKFLFRFLTGNKQRFLGKSHGGAQPNISKEIIVNSPFPLPPLNEQKRIVARIDEILDTQRHLDQSLEEYSANVETLKSKVIDAGIRGKLTEQLPEDGNAEDLYQQIQAEKTKLIKEGKIKKTKPLPPIKPEEIPFEIPENWKWVRLNDIALKITDGTHHSPENTKIGDYMYVTAKNIKDDGVDLSNITYVSKEVHEEISSRCSPELGDVLLIKDGATTGTVTVNNLSEPFSLLSSVALIKPIPHLMTSWYIAYVLRSDWFYKTIRLNMTGTGITRIILRDIETFIIPLPPLAEQERIADKIGEILHVLEQ